MRGFTLIEILLVISVTLVLAVPSYSLFNNLHKSAQLNESANQIIQTLRIARERSVAQLNNSPHGVYFFIAASPSKYVLYQGETFNSRNIAFDREYYLDNPLKLSTSNLILIGGNIDINFSQGRAAPSNIGSISIKQSNGSSRTISINSAGLIQED